MEIFGIKLKELRSEENLTQKELGDRLNVRNTTVSAWEQGIAEPPQQTLCEIAKYFGVTTDYLLGMEDETGAKSELKTNR